jgi:LysM repeat protein
VVIPVSAQDEPVHTVEYGENLFRISQDHGIPVDDIARANNLEQVWLIYPGQQLIIPVPNAEESQNSSGTNETGISDGEGQTAALAASTPEPRYYTVIYGQSLAQIAQAHGMSLGQLALLNNITNPDLIYAGQKLIVSGAPDPNVAPTPFPTSDVPGATNLVTHIVQPGETLASIADRYGISWLQIAQNNNIYDADQIRIGEELTIPGGSVLNAEYSFISASAAPPARIGVGKEVIVDLSDSRTYAYEDGKLIRNVLSSTGLPATPTIQGSFEVQRKYAAQTMTGPGYYLPDVPYVMYFYAGYALHGTYWHNNFGQPMSHGCVNLPTPEAGWFYEWTEIGTPIYVQT